MLAVFIGELAGAEELNSAGRKIIRNRNPNEAEVHKREIYLHFVNNS